MARTSVELGGSGFQIAYPVAERRLAIAKVNGDIPIACMRHTNARRKPLEKTAVVVMRPAISEALKIRVLHHADVALMCAIHNDNISRVEMLASMNKAHGRLPSVVEPPNRCSLTVPCYSL